MAFGEKKAAQKEEDALGDVLAEAKWYREQGAPVFFCSVRVEHMQKGLGGANFRGRQHGEFIAGVEALGWVLDKMDHVYIETGAPTMKGSGGSLKSGEIRGQYLFRPA